MSEDSESMDIPRILQKISNNSLNSWNGQNAFLIAYEGKPILLEAFSSEEAFRKTIQSTIRSLSFDIDHLDFMPTTKSEVKEFIENASLGKLITQQRNLTSMHFLGGGQDVDTNALTDANGHLLHITAINRRHRILQEV